MHINIDEVRYDHIKNVSFAPQCDLRCTSLPINQFSADIVTTDNIQVGRYAKLKDDRHVHQGETQDKITWAKYWITQADRINESTIHIVAESNMYNLDRNIMDAVYYDTEPMYEILSDIFGSVDYSVDVSYANVSITGFAPKQSARERLLWLCLITGCCVKTTYNLKPSIEPIDSTIINIPIHHIYEKPEYSYQDVVTAINITYYEFDKRTPQNGEKYVSDGTDTYVVTETTFSLQNAQAPSSALPNIVEIDGVYFINENNVSAIANRLSQYYFNRCQLVAKVINDMEYAPYDKVKIMINDTDYAEGHIQECTWQFGKRAASTIRLLSFEKKLATRLLINYKYNNVVMDRKTFAFSVGDVYSILNPYVDVSSNRNRYVYYPENEYATGTIVEGTNVNNQPIQIALHFDMDTETLHIISVTSVAETSQQGVIGIG